MCRVFYSYVQDTIIYVQHIIAYVGDIITYVQDTISYVQDVIYYVPDIISYEREHNTNDIQISAKSSINKRFSVNRLQMSTVKHKQTVQWRPQDSISCEKRMANL